jgi:hypothetical protein
MEGGMDNNTYRVARKKKKEKNSLEIFVPANRSLDGR